MQNGTHNHKAHYVHHGEGYPVVLLHGVAGSSHQWNYLIPALAEAGYRALAVDLLGHGASPRLALHDPHSRYHIEALYEHFCHWLETVKLDAPPVIVSHSMGSYLALTHALRGGLVRGLVLASPYYTPHQLTGPVRLSLKRPALSTLLLQNVPQGWIESVLLISDRYISDRYRPSLPEAALRQMAADFKRFDPRLISLPHTTEDLTPQLGRVCVPTLIVYGENDQTLAPASFPKLALHIPQAQSLALPDCGHVPHLTHTDRFNQAVLNFLHTLFTPR